MLFQKQSLQKKIQKNLDKYYKNQDLVCVKKVMSGSATGHKLNNIAFSIKAPYINGSGDNISLTLYYDTDDKDYVLSDDGFSYGAVAVNGIHKDEFLTKNIEYIVNSSKKLQIPTIFNKKTDAFQSKFTDLSQLANAYHSVMQSIMVFQGVLISIETNQQHEQQTIAIDEKNLNDLHNEIQERPDNANEDKSFYAKQENERNNDLSLLDDVEELIKIHATKAYVRELKEQVQTANEFLSAFAGIKGYPSQAAINSKELTKRLNNDVNNFLNRLKAVPELTGSKNPKTLAIPDSKTILRDNKHNNKKQ